MFIASGHLINKRKGDNMIVYIMPDGTIGTPSDDMDDVRGYY